MTRYEKAAAYIIDRLKNELAPSLRYHNISHVMDVFEAAERIGIAENISSEQLELLRLAALYHDAGFMVQSENHEEISCDIVREFLPSAGYQDSEIDAICGMIMATRIPQSPSNHLERIMCDADLDYLGRDDFFTTGKKVFDELIQSGVINNESEWNHLQISFLSSHNYFTDTAIKLRKQRKAENLEMVKQMVEQEK